VSVTVRQEKERLVFVGVGAEQILISWLGGPTQLCVISFFSQKNCTYTNTVISKGTIGEKYCYLQN
jgi:hypothetical protein